MIQIHKMLLYVSGIPINFFFNFINCREGAYSLLLGKVGEGHLLGQILYWFQITINKFMEKYIIFIKVLVHSTFVSTRFKGKDDNHNYK